jgi:hydroxymethylpyrimidine/phosphomethylpyrimidine kinase
MKVVLSIAGSDSSGGAGIQADLKTCEAFGVFGTSAITVLTAQNTQGVQGIYAVDSSFVQAQIQSVLSDFEVHAIKIGMLYSNEIIDVVKNIVKDLDIPIVLDPVFISKANSKLLNDDAVLNMKSLFKYCTLITPNWYEAQALFGENFSNIDSSLKVLIKNEKIWMREHYRSCDTLYYNEEENAFDTPYLNSNSTHGTGCSYSTAIACHLALGYELKEAIALCKKFIYLGIKNASKLGHGKGPIAHKIAGEICQLKED